MLLWDSESLLPKLGNHSNLTSENMNKFLVIFFWLLCCFGSAQGQNTVGNSASFELNVRRT